MTDLRSNLEANRIYILRKISLPANFDQSDMKD